MGFNALKYVEELEKAGVPEEQAKAQVRLLNEIVDSDLATKRDIKELDVKLSQKIKELEIGVKKEIKELELKLILKLGIMVTMGIGVIATLIKIL